MFLLQLLLDLLDVFTWLPPPDRRSRQKFSGIRGVVDRTPKGLCVATKFRCVLGLPVTPLASRVYRADAVNELDGVPIALCPRSVRAARWRAACWTAFAFAAAATAVTAALAVTLGTPVTWAAHALLATAGTFAGVVAAHRLHRNATPSRAEELARIARGSGAAFGFEVKTP